VGLGGLAVTIAVGSSAIGILPALPVEVTVVATDAGAETERHWYAEAVEAGVVDAGPLKWTPVENLKPLAGRWVSADRGDAVITRFDDAGLVVRELIEGATRAEFVRGKRGSRTPWNVEVWAPRGRMTSHDMVLGCGFYTALRDAWRTAYCRGYGLDPKGRSHATTIELRASPIGLERKGARLRLRIGSLINEELVRAP
jgi:hypothetical protein